MSQKYVKTYVPLSILVIGFILGGISLHAVPPAITLVPFETGFTSPIGIDFHQDVLNSENGIGDLIISSNYPVGTPHNLDLIQVPSGAHVPYSILNGLTEELKIATVRTTLGCQSSPWATSSPAPASSGKSFASIRTAISQTRRQRCTTDRRA
jgi:hypothetical protein